MRTSATTKAFWLLFACPPTPAGVAVRQAGLQKVTLAAGEL